MASNEELVVNLAKPTLIYLPIPKTNHLEVFILAEATIGEAGKFLHLRWESGYVLMKTRTNLIGSPASRKLTPHTHCSFISATVMYTEVVLPQLPACLE